MIKIIRYKNFKENRNHEFNQFYDLKVDFEIVWKYFITAKKTCIDNSFSTKMMCFLMSVDRKQNIGW